MNYGVPVDLLRFLGACVYGDAGAYYRALDDAARDALEREACAFVQKTSDLKLLLLKKKLVTCSLVRLFLKSSKASIINMS